jgi:hypothetical protein
VVRAAMHAVPGGRVVLRLRAALVVAACVAAALALAAPSARAEGASWRLEQPLPPVLPGHESAVPIGLGKIGDIEFFGPDRGLLITAGNPPTIPPGIWTYDGQGWHEFATVCGATDGRIAWAGPDEFWTIADGRRGQAVGEIAPPLADNTLCHFTAGSSEKGEVAGSYASLAFRADSYQAMHGAGCMASNDCWFAGDPLPSGQVGAFHLHWDGRSLSALPNPQGHGVEDMRLWQERLYESVRLLPEDLVTEEEPPFEPCVLHLIRPIETMEPPFLCLKPGVPTYAEGEFPTALDFMHLGASEETLWGAASPVEHPPAGSAPGEVTIVRDSFGTWTEVVGPGSDPPGGNPFAGETVNAVGVEPGSEGAWLALTSPANRKLEARAPAMVALVAGDGSVSDRQTLPTEQERAEGVGPKGVADKLVCPAVNDCWLATAEGWLFHLADDAHRALPRNGDPALAGLVTFRPADAGIPPVVPDEPPVDDSGLLGEPPKSPGPVTEASKEPRRTAPLVSGMHVRVHGTTLELRFGLATKARVRLLAKRHRAVVASTPRRTLARGKHMLSLLLDRARWPTKLDLQAHALGKLPLVSGGGTNSTSVSTAMQVLPRVPSAFGWAARR